MLHRELLVRELEKKSDEFRDFVLAQSGDLTIYLERFKTFAAHPYAEIFRRLGEKTDCGAVPSEEINVSQNFALGFREKWLNHEEARMWAAGILASRTTFAADGSQIFLEREISVPVAGIQIGWFENPHDAAASYEKGAEFHILSPIELLSDAEPFIRETAVGQRRFEFEIDKIKEFLERKRGWQERKERMPLAFYDNTLLLSIALPDKDFQTEFIDKLVSLVKLSAETRVPLVGYVDRSYARDLMTMLDAFERRTEPSSRTLDDVTILYASNLKKWGDRTPFCRSRRRGLSAFIDEETGESLVGFVYLQTTAENPPARLDIPSWVYDDCLLDEVIDTVRAECVVGLGYPYAIEAADQTAVIALRDREVFIQSLQAFAKENNLNLKVSRKAASKGRRR